MVEINALKSRRNNFNQFKTGDERILAEIEKIKNREIPGFWEDIKKN